MAANSRSSSSVALDCSMRASTPSANVEQLQWRVEILDLGAIFNTQPSNPGTYVDQNGYKVGIPIQPGRKKCGRVR